MLERNRRQAKFAVIAEFLAVLFIAGTLNAQIPNDNLFKDMRWRNIGPANMSGRVTDVEAVNDDFRIVYVGAASGGVWKSENAGNTWRPIFDNYGAASIGDLAIAPSNPDIVWVGTGEANNRNSVAWGNGIHKSTNAGASFEHMGLEDTHQIARVRIHPDNPNIVYVAAMGHLWGWSGDRGLFKTTDGGRTWTKLTNGLPDDGMHGANDLVIDPENPNTLYVTIYKRQRLAYRYDGGSAEGGIYKTTNGGNSWKKLVNGLPEGQTGRIGIDIYRSDPGILVALIEAEQSPESTLGEWSTMRGATHQSLDVPYSGIYRTENGGDSWEYLNTFNNRPLYFSQIRINPLDDQLVYVMTQSFRISEDGGKTLSNISGRTHPDYHAMWIDPNNKDRFYVGNDGGVILSHDQGNSYIYFDNIPIGQFYAISVDMREPYYIYGGLQDNYTWGGPSRSRDSEGILNDHWFTISGGDGFHTQVDPTDWRTVYSESQGGRIGRRNVETRQSTGIRPNRNNTSNWDEYDYTTDMNERERQRTNLRQVFRFNWSSPILLSPHNPHTVYFGGNHLFKSLNRGDNWTIISPDLSKNDKSKQQPSGGLTPDNTAAETHGTLITISESPVTPGVIWIGTDDGNVQLTRNGGERWENLSMNIPDVPSELWVSRIIASHADERTAFLTIDGHRSDNFQPWVFKTTDYGTTWTNIGSSLPDGHSIYVIKQDPKNPDLLFVGSEFDIFASTDAGNTWFSILKNMPNVAFHDLVIHPRDGDLIAATHGRALWIMDDITPLQQFTEEVRRSDAFLFESRPAVQWRNISRGFGNWRGDFFFRGENPPSGANIHYYLKSEPRDEILLEISDITGRFKHTAVVSPEPGINRYNWNMRFDPPQLTPEQRAELQQSGRGRGGRGFGRGRVRLQAEPGTYLVKLTVDGKTIEGSITIRPDPILKNNE